MILICNGRQPDLIGSYDWKGKLDIIGNEYAIPIRDNLRKDVSVMCNLSQGIKEDGIAIGEEKNVAI